MSPWRQRDIRDFVDSEGECARDIRGYFDSINHECLVKFVERRVADGRILRLIKKWLKAGVIENGRLEATEEGTPQGASISPLLSNVYLHYALDIWVQDWRKREARGDAIIVRWADDFVMGFQCRDDAERFLKELRERFRNIRWNFIRRRLA